MAAELRDIPLFPLNVALFPGMALLLTVLAFNLVGDGMQDALNPKGTRST